MNTAQAAFHYIGAFVDELARSGLRHVVVCPGSRSTPVALMLAEEPRIKIWLHLDERSGAFFALGMAKALRQPVGVLCTSGTAAANFLPAVVEASLSRVPLVVMTADRPPELRDSGAAQTIDQVKLYGTYAKWFVEMGLPEASVEALRYARNIAGRAVAAAEAWPGGVVHINMPLREPLVPIESPQPDEWAAYFGAVGRQSERPYVRANRAGAHLGPDDAQRLAGDLRAAPRGLIVAGPNNDASLAPALTELAARLGYPILADPLSGLRSGRHDRANIVDAYDAFLRDPSIVKRLAPDVVLIFGALATSKPVLQFVTAHSAARQILIGPEWSDPNRLAGEQFPVDGAAFCKSIIEAVGLMPVTPTTSEWQSQWRTIQAMARSCLDTATLAIPELFEGRVFTELAQALPNGATLWASSSMPVRDLDTFFAGSDKDVRFLSNRGANGIDGVVSSALGAAAVSGGPLVLVIGDIAFYHDMNGLLAAKLHQLNATIVLINNDGGGIFSFLPQAEHPKHFEALFGTPHGLHFDHVAGIYDVYYARPADWDGFRAAIRDGFVRRGLSIIEVRTNRATNVAFHRMIWPQVSAAVTRITD